MAVNEQSAEEKQSSATDQKLREDAFAKKIIGNLDLPSGLSDAIDDEIKESKKTAKQAEIEERQKSESEDVEESNEENSEEEISEEESEDEDISEEVSEDELEGDGESEDEDEELSPESKNKAQKRIDELIKKNKLQAAELNRLKSSKVEQEVESSDPDQKTLDRIASEPDALQKLKNLKRDVMATWKNESDKVKADQLLDLQEKIDATISSIPQKFETRQLKSYQEAVKETVEAYGESFDKKAGDAIFAEAKSIFSRSKILQSHVDGQAEAWRQAVQSYEKSKKMTEGKLRTDDLKRQNNTLKKKVSLDVAVSKGKTIQSDDKRLFNKAKTGNTSDKTAFIKKHMNTDSLIPEEYRRR